MRHQQSETSFSKRAYYFGLISLVLYGVQAILKWTMSINDQQEEGKLPMFLLWICLFVLLFTATTTIYNALRSIKEPKTFKGIIGWVLGLVSVLFLIHMFVALL